MVTPGHWSTFGAPLTARMTCVPTTPNGSCTCALNDPCALVLKVPRSYDLVCSTRCTPAWALKPAPETVIVSPTNGCVVLTESEPRQFVGGYANAPGEALDGAAGEMNSAATTATA